MLLPMSLKTRKRPTLLHAGPSSHRPPVHNLLIALFGRTTPSNAGSTVRMSGSVKYVVGWLKSRGGLLTTVGGVARCAKSVSPPTAAPATAPIAFIAARREIPRLASLAGDKVCCVLVISIVQ